MQPEFPPEVRDALIGFGHNPERIDTMEKFDHVLYGIFRELYCSMPDKLEFIATIKIECDSRNQDVLNRINSTK